MVGRMNDGSSAAAPADRPADHVTITPAILYFGTPVVLLTTETARSLAPVLDAGLHRSRQVSNISDLIGLDHVMPLRLA